MRIDTLSKATASDTIGGMKKWVFASALCASGLGCVVSPIHGEHVGSRSSPVYFDIYATSSGASMQMTCSHHYGNVQVVSNFTGGTSPATIYGETVYPSGRSVTLPSSCWETWSGDDFSYITYIRVKQGEYNALVFDEEGSECLGDQLGMGVGPISAALECRRDGPDILLLANP